MRPLHRRFIAFLLAPAWVAMNQPKLAYGKAVGLVSNNPSFNPAAVSFSPPAGTITREHCDAVKPLVKPPLSWVVMINGEVVNSKDKDEATDPASIIKTLTLGLLAIQAKDRGINLDDPIPPELWVQAIHPEKILDPKLRQDLQPYAVTSKTSYISDFRPEVFKLGQDGLPESSPTYREIITLIYHKSDNALAQGAVLFGLFSGEPVFYAEMTDSLNALAAKLSPQSKTQPFCLLSASGYPHIDHPLKQDPDGRLTPYPSRTTQITPGRLAEIINNLSERQTFPKDWLQIFGNPNMVFHGRNFPGNNANFIEAVEPTYQKTGTSYLTWGAATIKYFHGIRALVVTGGVDGRLQQPYLLGVAEQKSIVIAEQQKEEFLGIICQGSMESLCLGRPASSGFSLFSLQPSSTQTAESPLINGGFLAALNSGNSR